MKDNDAKDIFPLVSVFVEACGRVDYFKMALNSVINQTYSNIEIIVIDRGLTDECKKSTALYLKKYPNIKYYKYSALSQDENIFRQLLKISSGEYISYLTDDGIYHKERIRIMMNVFLAYDDISLVTSHRQLIDRDGKYLNDGDIKRKLFDNNSMLDGKLLVHLILPKIFDVIDEMTIPLFKRKAIEADIENNKFGIYEEKQDKLMADLLTWMNMIDKEKTIYLSDALSYFRIHDIRDQRKVNTLLHELLHYLILKNNLV